MSLSLYCSPYPAPSVTSAAIFYDGGVGDRVLSFPPIHENRPEDLLKQYSTAATYTSQTSFHLKVQHPLRSQLLGRNPWNYPHRRPSRACSYSRKLLTWLCYSPRAEVTVCLSALGSSFQSAAQGKKKKKKPSLKLETGGSLYRDLEAKAQLKADWDGEPTDMAQCGPALGSLHSTAHPMIDQPSASPPGCFTLFQLLLTEYEAYQKENTFNNSSYQMKALSNIALSNITVLTKLSPSACAGSQ